MGHQPDFQFALYEVVDNQPVEAVKGQVEGIGTAPHFVAKNPAGALLAESYWERVAASQGHARAFKQIWSWLAAAAQGRQLLAVGHRVGHGGETFADPVLIDARVLEILTGLIPLVPLRQPSNLAAIRAVAADHPQVPQVACFDTGFHRGRPRVTEQLGLPRALLERGVKRYGLHGLSYALVFTAGVGENDAAIRARVCRDAAWLGIKLDETANQQRGPRISPAGSTPSVWVIPTDEEAMIARHTLRMVRGHTTIN